MNKNKHNQPQFTAINVAILMLVATALGSTLMWLMIQYDLSEWHHQVNRHFYHDFDSFKKAISDYPADLVAVVMLSIVGGWAYGLIQVQLFQLFQIKIYRWIPLTVIATVIGIFSIIVVSKVFFYPIDIYLRKQDITWWRDLNRLFLLYYAYFFAVFTLPIGIVQTWLMNRQFHYAWLWLLVHSFGSLVFGLIIFYGEYRPNLDDPKLYITAISFSLVVATSFLWIIRHPRRGLLKANLDTDRH